ncbi:MAG: hypothetical protein ACFCUV_00535, partial [Rivularia sp. (in: cyanobacteria)]
LLILCVLCASAVILNQLVRDATKLITTNKNYQSVTHPLQKICIILARADRFYFYSLCAPLRFP